MNRRYILLAVAALLVVAWAVPNAFAAITDQQQKAINDIVDQMTENQKQLIQQYVDAGQITQNQADLYKQRIDLMNQYRKNWNTTNISVYAPGAGSWGGGPGFCGGPGMMGGGPGSCRGWGGWGW